MNFLTGKTRGEEAFQMAAMVDVVFILLAFFVLASEFNLPERDVAMGHSKAKPLAKGTAAEDFPAAVPVRLQRSGTDVVITIGQARLRNNDFDGIRGKLTEINMPAIRVQIQADEDLAIDPVVRAIDAVLASPMKVFSVSRLSVAPPAG